MKLNKWKAHRNALMLSVLFCAFAATPFAHAQDGNLRLAAMNTSVGNVLREIETQTGLSFVISHKNFDVHRNVNVTAGTVPVKDALGNLLTRSGYAWIVDGRHVIIVPAKEKDTDPAKIPAERLMTLSQALADSAASETVEQDPPAQPKTGMREVKRIETVTTQRTEVAFDGADREFYIDTRSDLSKTAMYSRPPRFAVKLNLLHGAALQAPNLGVEFGLGRKTSLDIYAAYNPWKRDNDEGNNKKMVHTVIQPELRLWLCERFNGHFFGIHAMYANYNVSGHNFMSVFDKQYRYEGWAWGGGVSYGYHWAITRGFGIEFNIGAGIARMKYDRFDCEWCGDRLDSKTKTYFGPTKAGVTLVFTIK